MGYSDSDKWFFMQLEICAVSNAQKLGGKKEKKKVVQTILTI